MNNPFDQFDSTPSAAPQAPGVIRGKQKQPTQLQTNADQRAADANARAASAEARALEAESRSNAANVRSQTEFENKQSDRAAAGGVDASVEQGRAASFYKRASMANTDYEASGLDPDSMIGKAAASIAPDATSYVSSDARNAQRGRELDFIGAVLRYESGAAIPPSEIESAYKVYFPTPGAGPEEIASKKKARQNVIDGLRIGAGPAGALVDDGGGENEEVVTYNPNPNLEVGDDGKVYDKRTGQPAEADGYESGLLREYDVRVQRGADAREKEFGKEDYTKRAQSGTTFGLSDELAGAGYSLGRLFQGDTSIVDNYTIGRDVDRELYRRADERTGFAGDALEFTSAMAIPGAAVKTIKGAAGVGAGFGGVGGFGYGEGVQGSTTNALLGAAGGTILGAGAQKLGNALASKAPSANNAQPLAAAGKAEGVTVNRAMVDPSLQPKFTGNAGTMVGSRKIQRGLNEIGRQIEGRVGDLGRGGSARVNETGGDLVQEAAKRSIDKTGAIAKRKYDRAEKASAGVKIEPKESLQRVDEMIKQLSETPSTNAAEIAFLKTIKSDLSPPQPSKLKGEIDSLFPEIGRPNAPLEKAGLSVGSLRRMRTSLRKKISKGELTFGEDEARVLAIMDGAADDIRAGLVSQGKPGAARLFDVADKSYRARQEFINGTVQKIIGKRSSPLSSEQIFRKFKSMATPGGDAKGLRKMYAALDKGEAADVAATFAESLGKNNKGDFSTAHFVSQAEKIPDSALTTIFGKEGAQSVKNLKLLSKEHSRLVSAAGGSQTGLRMDYKGWLWNAVAGVAAGGATANVSAGAGAAIGLGAAKLAKDLNTSRLLMSPKITRWLRTAPKSTSPKAIDAHFGKLGEIAKGEPALAGDIKSLQDLILKSANDNAQRAAASDQQ